MPGSLEVIAKYIIINFIVQNRSSVVGMCAHKWVRVHSCLFAYVYVCMCSCVCVCVCVCACAFMSIIGIYAGYRVGTHYLILN